MKLKFLFKLNALLIICSFFLNISAGNINKIVLNDQKSQEIYKANDEIINNKNAEKMNIGNLEDSKSLIESKPVKIKFVLKKSPNPSLKTDAKSIKNLTTYKKCKLITGVVNFVTQYDYIKNSLSVKPLFYSINPKSINFYESTNTSKSLYSTVSLISISKLSLNFSGTNCVSFVKNVGNNNEKDSVSICPNDEKEATEWINNVTEIKECGFQVEENNVNVIFDYNKTNILLKEIKANEDIVMKQELEKVAEVSPDGKQVKPFGTKKFIPLATINKDKSTAALKVRKALEVARIKILEMHNNNYNNKIIGKNKVVAGQNPDELNGLFYDNSQKVNRKPTVVASRHALIKKELGKIIHHIKEGKVARQQLERKMRCKISKAEKIKKDVELQKSLIKNIVEERALKARERNAILGQNLLKNKEIHLMKAVDLQIQKLNKEQFKAKKTQLRTTLNTIRGITNKKISSGNLIFINSDKLTDYGKCVDSKLIKFKDLGYVTDICLSYYGQSEKNECIQKLNFCSMCCNFHIGSHFGNKLFQCKNECQSIVNGKRDNSKLNKK